MQTFTKALVLYYSRSGNTRKVAHAISDSLHCEIDEIKTPVHYEKGILGYAKALYHSLTKKRVEIYTISKKLGQYDLVLIGSPVWGGAMAPPIRSFLSQNKSQLKTVAYFLTQGGTDPREAVLKDMQNEAGAAQLATLVIPDRDLKNSSFKKAVETFTSNFKVLELPKQKSGTG
jgi:flavodoxin